MLRISKILGSGLFGLMLLAFSSSIFGQDLGSSNGLFRASNPKSNTPAAEKKAPAKSAASRNTAAKTPARRAPVRRTPARAASQKTVTARSSAAKTKQVYISKKSVVINQVEPENTIITVGKTTAPNFIQLYEEAIDEGNTARDARDYGKAESAYQRAKNLNPKDSRAVYGLGNLYSDQQRWEESEKFYREALRLEPDNSDPYIALSFVLTQPIIGAELSSRFIEAERSARKAIALNPQNPFAYDQLGVALELNGKISRETENYYQRAIKIDPEFALAYAHLGRLLRRMGKIKESTEAYTKAISFSNDVPTMILVADVLQSQQRFGDSEQLLRRALREDSKNPTALYLLGRALTIRGEYNEAEKILKKSVEISPNSFVSYVLLGSLYSRRGDFSDAEKTLNNALKVITDNERKNLALAFETVGDGYLKKGKKDDALRAYRQAVALDSKKPALSRKLASVQL